MFRGYEMTNESVATKQCALHIVEQVIPILQNIHKPEYHSFDIYEPRMFHLPEQEESNSLNGYEILHYWQQVKEEIEKL